MENQTVIDITKKDLRNLQQHAQETLRIAAIIIFGAILGFLLIVGAKEMTPNSPDLFMVAGAQLLGTALVFSKWNDWTLGLGIGMTTIATLASGTVAPAIFFATSWIPTIWLQFQEVGEKWKILAIASQAMSWVTIANVVGYHGFVSWIPIMLLIIGGSILVWFGRTTPSRIGYALAIAIVGFFSIT